MPLFYCPEIAENKNNIIKLSGDEFHHLANVFRKKNGDEITLSSGTGYLAKAVITELTKKHAMLNITSKQYIEKSKPRVCVAFSLLRNKHDSFIIEKLTELGVSEFYPIVSEFTVRKNNSNTTLKFEQTAIAALKQCDNAWLPEVHDTINISQLIKTLEVNKLTPLLASEIEQSKTLFDISDFTHDVCFIIGPEGGFSKNEFEMFTKAGVQDFKLSNHILRAETAAVTCISQYIFGILKNNSFYY